MLLRDDVAALLGQIGHEAVSERVDVLIEAAASTSAINRADEDRVREAREARQFHIGELDAEKRRVGGGPVLNDETRGNVLDLGGEEVAFGQVYGGQWTTAGTLAELERRVLTASEALDKRVASASASAARRLLAANTLGSVTDYLADFIGVSGVHGTLKPWSRPSTIESAETLQARRRELLMALKRYERAFEGPDAEIAAAFEELEEAAIGKLLARSPTKSRKLLGRRWRPVRIDWGGLFGQPGVAAAGSSVPAGVPVIARLLKEEIQHAIRAEIEAHYRENPQLVVVPPDQRTAEVHRLREELGEVGHLLAESVWLAAKEGEPVLFPDGLPAACILGVAN